MASGKSNLSQYTSVTQTETGIVLKIYVQSLAKRHTKDVPLLVMYVMYVMNFLISKAVCVGIWQFERHCS
jgi:hypothetical protein